MEMYMTLRILTFVFAVIAIIVFLWHAITQDPHKVWLVIIILVVALSVSIVCDYGAETIEEKNTTTYTETVPMVLKKIVVDNETSEFYLILFNEKTNKEIKIKAAPGWIDCSKNVVDVEIITTTFFDEVSQEFKIKEV